MALRNRGGPPIDTRAPKIGLLEDGAAADRVEPCGTPCLAPVQPSRRRPRRELAWLIPSDAHCHFDRDLLVRTALTNVLTLYALGMTLFLTAVHVASGLTVLVASNVLSLVLFALPLYLNATRRFAAARILFLGTALVEMALYSWIYGHDVGLKNFYFVATMTPLLMFAPTERRALFMGFALVIVGFSTVRWLEVRDVPPVIRMEPEVLAVMGHSYNVAALLIGLLQGWLMYKLVQRRERRLTEVALLKANSAKFGALGQMAGSIGHEMMTPLTVVRRNAAHLRDHLTGAAPAPDPLAKVERIITAAEQMTSVARGLRVLCRDSGAATPVPFALAAALQDVEALARERAALAGVTLEFRVPEAGVEALGDRVQATHAVLNLVNNSLDAVEGRPGGRVRVEVRDGPADAPPTVEIVVEDDGPGVPEGLEDRIMEPFFTTKGLESGTGIGLSISRATLRQAGGDLVLERPRGPTRFVVRLRRGAGSASAA